jgi:hypothetical protein
MRVKPIFVAISLFFPTALLFAKNIEQEKILEVNTQQHPPSASYEKNRLHQRRKHYFNKVKWLSG